MKVGMIFECGPDGADRKVCEHLAKRIKPDLKIESVPLDSKPKMIRGCGQRAALLLAGGCERVVIVWDLYPAWRERGAKPCRKEDRDSIMRSLKAADVDTDKVFLVCIEEELEAWLLADHRATSQFLSKPHRKVKLRPQRFPERDNPKKRLRKIFNKHIGRDYVDRDHAENIAKAIPDFKRLRKVETFRRFALKIADVKL